MVAAKSTLKMVSHAPDALQELLPTETTANVFVSPVHSTRFQDKTSTLDAQLANSVLEVKHQTALEQDALNELHKDQPVVAEKDSINN